MWKILNLAYNPRETHDKRSYTRMLPPMPMESKAASKNATLV